MRDRATVSLPVLGAVCLLLVLSGCSAAGSGDESGDPLQVVENPVAAQAAQSPAVAATPAGDVFSVDGAITGVSADANTDTLAVARADPPAVLLHGLDESGTTPRAQVSVPGRVSDLSFAGEYVLASVPSAGTVLRIPLSGDQSGVERVEVRGKPTATARHGSRTLIALRDGKAVLARDDGGGTTRMPGNLYSVDDVVVAGNVPFALDRVRTALFRVDVEAGEIAEGLRAGRGATNAAVTEHGRVLVTDTRGGALLAFSPDPFLLRQRYPVPGGIYGIAYDAHRDLAWVTLTGRNEVVGYDVAGGQPTEEYRIPTVRQPNSLTVDERTGHVIVGSAAGEGLQVIAP